MVRQLVCIVAACAVSLGACVNEPQGPSEATEGTNGTGTGQTTASSSQPTDGAPTTGDTPQVCGLACDEQAFERGQFTISGITALDAYFEAVLQIAAETRATARQIDSELEGLYALVGAVSSAEFKAALDVRLSPYIDAGVGFTVQAAPSRCEVPLALAAAAASACDAGAPAGSVVPVCGGTCTIDAAKQSDCQATGGLICQGIAPNLQCEGVCRGDCQLDVAAACAGVCRGVCNGEDFEGTCQGMCQGTCELGAGGTCQGRCAGRCESVPLALCGADQEARCSTTVEAGIACRGPCEGDAEVDVALECAATVEARTAASVQCQPPGLTLRYVLSSGDPDAALEFRAFAYEFRVRYGALLAAVARAERLIEAGATLAGAGAATVNSFASSLLGTGELDVEVGSACAIASLPAAQGLVTEAGAQLQAQISGAVQVIAAVSAP